MLDQKSGILFMTIFGAIWWWVGCAALPTALRWVGTAVGALVVGAILLASRRRIPETPSTAIPASVMANVQRQFTLVTIAEAVLILAAVIAGVASGHPRLIPALVCLIVGLHFWPLAKIFAVPAYLVTASALVAVAIMTLALLPAIGEESAAWQWLPALSASLILWATAAYLNGSLAVRRRHR